MRNHHLLGAIVVLASAVLFGLQPLYGDALNRAAVDPYALNTIRFSVPALLLLVWAVACGQAYRLRSREFRQHGWMGVCIAGTGVGYYQAGFQVGFGLAVILFFSFPLMVTAYNRWVIGVTLSRTQWIAMLGSLSGLIVAIDLGDAQWNPTGIAWALFSGACYAAMLVFKEHHAPKLPDHLSLLALMAIGSAVMLAMVSMRGAQWPADEFSWAVAIGLAIFAGLIPIGLLLLGTRMIGSLDTATLSTLEPVVAIAVSVAFLGEGAGWRTYLGAGLVIASAVVLTRASNQTRSAGVAPAGAG